MQRIKQTKNPCVMRNREVDKQAYILLTILWKNILKILNTSIYRNREREGEKKKKVVKFFPML